MHGKKQAITQALQSNTKHIEKLGGANHKNKALSAENAIPASPLAVSTVYTRTKQRTLENDKMSCKKQHKLSTFKSIERVKKKKLEAEIVP